MTAAQPSDERHEAWRVGRKVGRTIYNERDELIGVMDTPELAAEVVGAVNAGRPALRAEGATGAPAIPRPEIWAAIERTLRGVIEDGLPAELDELDASLLLELVQCRVALHRWWFEQAKKGRAP